MPYSDCCSYVIAKHPETNAKLDKVLEVLKEINFDDEVKKIVSSIKTEES